MFSFFKRLRSENKRLRLVSSASVSNSANRPLMLVGGCSYTDPNWKDRNDVQYSFDRWPTIFNSLIGDRYTVVNTAMEGASNGYIMHRVLSELHTNHRNVGLVVVGWTELLRSDIVYAHNLKLNHTKSDIADEAFVRLTHPNTMFMTIEDFVTRVVTLQTICDHYGVPLLMFQGTSLFKWSNVSTDSHPSPLITSDSMKLLYLMAWKKMLKSTLYKLVDPTRFWGWPGIDQLGGKSFNSLISPEMEMTVLCGYSDGHPNSIGHGVMAKHLAEFYDRHY